MYAGKQRRFSPLLLIGVGVTLLVVLGAGGFLLAQQFTASHAANTTPNPNCTIVVPPNPLSAQGLMTPYQLVATDPAQGPCNEANANQSAFVQAVILDPFTGQMSAYEPLVIDQGTQPAVKPAPVNLPRNAIVAIWFGDNGTILTLKNNVSRGGRVPHGLVLPMHHMGFRGGNNGNCVNGSANSPFGQFGYCNAPNFFRVANALIAFGRIHVPALGTGSDGKPCPTTRDFSIVDMDQSDNVQTLYLANANGQIAQFSAANKAALANATTIGNPSDNALVTKFVDPALNCKAWTIPDQVDNNNPVSTYGTDELQAARFQQPPQALVPAGDEMVLVNNNPNLTKVNLYRIGADQRPAFSLNDASTTTYCQNLVKISLPKLVLDQNTFKNQPSPDGGATANSLFTFLANRLNATLGAGGLNCVGLLNIQNPVTLTVTNMVVTDATITTTPVGAGATPTPAATPTAGTTPGATPTVAATPTSTPAAGGATQVSGRVNIMLDPNAGNAQVGLNLNFPNFANQQFMVTITDKTNGKQVLNNQPENTDGNGANAASTVINGLQGLKAIPSSWVATITDANGNLLGTAPVMSNGANATATFAANNNGNGNGNNGQGNGNGKHHHN